MITNINVMILNVENQDVMLDFFVDKLGFEKTTDGEMWPGARWLEVKPAGAQTGLVLAKAADFKQEPDNGYPGTFSCDDLERTRAKYADAGVTVSEISHEPWGSYFWVTDPEGRQFIVNNVQ
jgi:lactoylglutathione lyase